MSHVGLHESECAQMGETLYGYRLVFHMHHFILMKTQQGLLVELGI